MTFKLMKGDCIERMKEISDKSIDLVVTSPPYDNLRKYNNSSTWSFEVFKKVANELKRVIKEGGVIVWVVGDSTIKGSESGSSFKQALYFKEECGLNLHDTMIYSKNNVVPLTHKRYEQAFEYMFIVTKGPPLIFNGIKDKENKWAGTFVHGTQYVGDTTKKVSNHNKSIIGEFGLRSNIFNYNNQGNKSIKHPAVFPLQLAVDHILSWSNEGDTILEPFMGSGTTGLACRNTKRNFIGIEIDETYFKIAKNRIKNGK